MSTQSYDDANPPKYEHYVKIADFLKEKTKVEPKVMIICGSGLGGLAEDVENKEAFEYKDIPGFPTSTVAGHKGRLVFGTLGGVPVMCMQGRFHTYEGYPLWKATMPVRIAKLMGVHSMIVTNASGGLNADYNVCDIMVMADHINVPGLGGKNPLVGHNVDEFGPRFPPMNLAYDREYQKMFLQLAEKMDLGDVLRKGVYAFVSGPSYETPTECKFLRMIGADAVGMSTAPEVVVAVHCGLRCLGLSLVTNCVVMDLDAKETANHEEVMEAANSRGKDMCKLVKAFLEQLGGREK